MNQKSVTRRVRVLYQLICILALYLVGTVGVQAEVLAGYDFDTGVGEGDDVSTPEANVVGANVTVSDFGTVVGLSAVYDFTFATSDALDAEGNTFGTTNMFAFGGTGANFGFDDFSDADDLSGAIQANDFLTFTVTPDDGYGLNLDSLTFRTFIQELANSAERWGLFSSIDGFADGAEIATGQTTDVGTWDAASNNNVVDLSDARFQNLGEAVEFRIYVYGGGENTNSITLFDKVVLNGIATKNVILVGYDFDADASDPSAATMVADKILASQLTSSMAIDFVSTVGDNSGVLAAGDAFGTTNTLGCVGVGVDDATTGSFEDAVAGDDYVTFTVTPDEGEGFRLTQLSFKATREATTSVDEYAVADASGNMIGTPAIITNVVGLTGAYDGVSIDLTGTAYEFISEATEFRIYAWGRGTSSTSGTLAAIDKVALYGDVSNDSGRNSHFWMTLKPLAGTESATDTDLILNNGYRSVDLSSPDLSCTRVDNGSNWEYQIVWAGNSLLDGPEAEILEFSVVVEAFSGADYIYEEDNGTVSSLGTASTPADIDNRWGVGGDYDVDPGESIRMTRQNMTVAGEDLSATGLVLENVSTSTLMRETNGGSDHKMIFGEGTNLSTAIFSSGTVTIDAAAEPFSVTGAGSSAEGKEWAIEELSFSFIVRNPALTVEDPDNLFSDLKLGYTMGATPYAPTMQAKLDNAFPEFSWDRIPRITILRKSGDFTEYEYDVLATNYPLVILEKSNGGFWGYQTKSAGLEARNPNIKTVMYWNSRIYFGHYGIDDEIESRWDEFIDPDYKIRGLPTYQRDNPDLIDWWIGVPHKMMGLVDGYASVDEEQTLNFTNSTVDGYFIDKTGVPISMLQPLYEGTPDDKFCMNNNSSNRTRLPYLDGTYREAWDGAEEKRATVFAVEREKGLNNKLTMLRTPVKRLLSEREFEDKVDERLALYLTYAENYAYFNFQGPNGDATDPHYEWLTGYIDQFKRPLGAPLGQAIRDNLVWTRGFERCDLYMNMGSDPEVYRVLWKNDVGSPTLAGSGGSSNDDTYTLQGGGNISGTSDNFFFLSDLHYGNGEIVARIDSLDNTHADVRAGVMFRERNEPDDPNNPVSEAYWSGYEDGTIIFPEARMIAVVRKPGGDMEMVYRSATGGAMAIAGTGSANLGPYTKLTRSVDLFTGYCSPDGETWTQIGQVNISLDERLEMGMAVASGDNAVLAEAKFSAFSRVESKPVADALSVTLDEDTSAAITLTGSDAYGSTLTYALTSLPTNGVLSGTAPNVTYTPDTNFFGSDSFTFTMNDGFADSEVATVSITVEPVEDPPYAGAQPALSVIGFDNIYSSSLADSSLDPDGDTLSYTVLSGPAWLTVASDGTLSGSPSSADTGLNSWIIDVEDGNGNVATITLNIAVAGSVLIGYDFDATASDKSAATVVPANVTASQFTSPMATAFVTTIGDISGVDAAGVNFGSTNTLGCVGIGVNDAITSSFEDALAGDDYMTFTVTPDAGAILQLYSFTFKASLSKTSSVDEYAVTDGSGNLIGTAASITSLGNKTTYDEVTISLVGTAYEFITEATEFRIYAWGRGTSSTTGTLALLDKVALHGRVSDLLVGYDFDGGSSDATLVAATMAASQFTSPMAIAFVSTIGDNSGVDAAGVEFGTTNTLGAVGIGVNDAITYTFDDAVAGDDYMSFTVTPEAGCHLTQISFKASLSKATSVDEYAVTDALGNLIGTATSITNIGQIATYEGVSVSLVGTAYEFITEATEFRIYAWGRGTSNTSGSLAMLDKVTIHGRAYTQLGSVNEDESLAAVLSGSEGDDYVVVSAPVNGTLSGTAPNLTYTPNADFNGSDSFTVTVNGVAETVFITVNAANDAPVANALVEWVHENGSVGLTLTGSDVENDPLTYSVVTSPANGTLSGTAPNLTYTPDAETYGSDAFTFTVNDGTVDSVAGTVSITVLESFIYPAGSGSGYDVTAAEAAAFRSTGTAKSFDADGDGAYGTAGSWFVGDGMANGAGATQDHSPAWATNFVRKTTAAIANTNLETYDDPALAIGATVSNVTVGAAIGADMGNAGDWGELLTFEITAATPDQFRLGIMSGAVTGTSGWTPTGLRLSFDGCPAVEVTGLDVELGMVFFDIDVTDLTTGTFTIEGQNRAASQGATLTGVTFDVGNDAPIANALAKTVSEDGAISLTLTGSDANGDSLTYAVATSPANGSLSGTAPNLTYTPNVDYNGADSFTFTVNDGTVNSAAATVSIAVNAVNDAPVADAQSVAFNEDGSLAMTLTGSDVDGDSLAYAVVTAPANGSLSGTAPNLTYTPNADYNGADSFTFTVNDGTVDSAAATVSITVTAVNDAPVFSADPIAGADGMQNSAYAGSLSAADIDSDSLSYSKVSGPTWLTVASDGSLSGTPQIGDIGANSWTVAVSDGDGGTDQAVLNISVDVDPNPAVRVTEYYLTTGDFSGTNAIVTLDQDLADDYFILVRGSRTGDGQSNPNNDYARIVSVPGGKGDLADSGATDEVGLQRKAADFDWEGVVTVVECVNSASAAGFKLIDTVVTSMDAVSGTDTGAAWSDVNQVVLFGGYRGGGVEMFGTPTDEKEGTGCYARLYPSGTNRLNWSRDAGGETMFDATMTTFVVEWGSEWTVQHVNVAGSNGSNGANAVGEYTTAAIGSVVRSNTWIWATGTRADSGIGDCAESCLVTLGDGVNQNASESTVAVGSEYTDAYDFDVYALTHAGIQVSHHFKADGDLAELDVAVPVNAALVGTRFGWVYNGSNGTGSAFPRPRFWSRYTSDSEVTISRGYDGQAFPAWVQGIDLSGLNH